MSKNSYFHEQRGEKKRRGIKHFVSHTEEITEKIEKR